MVISTCGSFCWALKRSCLRDSKCMPGKNLYFRVLKIRHYSIFSEPIAFEWQKSKTTLWGEEKVMFKCLLYFYILAMKQRGTLRLKEEMFTRSKEPEQELELEPEPEPKPELEPEPKPELEPDEVHLLPSCKPRLARKSAWVLNIRQFT